MFFLVLTNLLIFFMKQHYTILICYLELSGYFIACIETLVGQINADVHIVKKVTNKEAPFDLKKVSNKIHFYNEIDLDYSSLNQLAKDLKPDLYFCGGWSEKKYLKLAKNLNNSIPTIIGFDNKWEGNFKQQILLSFGKAFIKPKFKFAFVPGQKQKQFAQKLGFSTKNIFLGAYSADIKTYTEIAIQNNKSKSTLTTKHFLYIGRYIKHKGIFDMWDAFIELQNEAPNEWELWCIGTGEEEKNKPLHPKIKHFGFIQPKDMINYLKPNGVYVLPSHFEPWGVSVHEMTAAGYPLILSSEVGAKEVFLSENGFEIQPQKSTSIKEAMQKIINLSNEELIEMGLKSIELSKKITPLTWSNQIIKMLQN